MTVFETLARQALAMGWLNADPLGLFDVLHDPAKPGYDPALRHQFIEEWRSRQSEYPWMFPREIDK